MIIHSMKRTKSLQITKNKIYSRDVTKSTKKTVESFKNEIAQYYDSNGFLSWSSKRHKYVILGTNSPKEGVCECPECKKGQLMVIKSFTTKKRFIGHLQTNKVNKCLNLFDTIDSVDSYRLASKIDTSARNKNIKIECLLEINTSGEKQKHGFKPEINKELLSCFDLKNLNITGLMTVGPNTQDKNKIRKSFSLLREIKENINENISTSVLTELSMGMSGDYDIGIQEGSTMVRVGTSLFGKREY